MLKKKLAKLNFEQSTLWILKKLAYVDNKGLLEAKEWAPWYLLLFLRYAGKEASNKAKTTEHEIYSTYAYYDAYIKSQSDAFLSEQNQDVMRFFLRLAHQQFIFQTGLTGLKYKVARQSIFFSSFDDLILAKFGIQSREFLKLSFMLFTIIEKGDRTFKDSIFNSLKNLKRPEAVQPYLKLISTTPEDFIAHSKESIRYREFEIYDNLFFRKKPIIKIESEYIVFSKFFFYELLAYGIYDSIKETRETRAAFGRVFENYAQQRITNSIKNSLTEESIRSRLPRTANEPSMVDAIIPTPKSIVLLEYKATELPEDVRLNPSDENIEILKHNLIKAIAQGYKSLATLDSNKELFPEINLGNEKFLLITSYKETYLGTARSYWNSIQPVLTSVHGLSDFSTLSPDNIFFISIDDLDWLLSLDKKLEEAILTASERFKKHDAHHMSQVLAKFVDKKFKIPELDKKFEEILSECILDLGVNRESFT